jgi:hypothetical protein
MKYMEQGLFCYGVAAVIKKDGATEGRCCLSYDYTGRNAITIDKDESMMNVEIVHVCGLTGSVGRWVEDNCGSG